jgi:ABC-type antimicrobial peptide transport system permease subunit
VFAGLAFVLSLIGLYGVISHTVTRRSREIGVRLALGASPRAVLNMVMGEGLRLTGAGLLAGAAAALALTRILSGLLYGVKPRDPLTFIIAMILLGAGSLIASWIPARRATTVDPLVVLRAE